MAALGLAVLKIFSRLAFEPVVSGGLLLLLTKTPLEIREKIVEIVPWLSNGRNIAYTLRALRVLLGLGISYRIHGTLNWLARNHWSIRNTGEPWDFSGNKEVAVVTGGCSGFGLLITKALSKKCKVVVLDIQQPPQELKNCK